MGLDLDPKKSLFFVFYFFGNFGGSKSRPKKSDRVFLPRFRPLKVQTVVAVVAVVAAGAAVVAVVAAGAAVVVVVV